MPKIFVKFLRDYPKGALNASGMGKNCVFRPHSRSNDLSPNFCSSAIFALDFSRAFDTVRLRHATLMEKNGAAFYTTWSITNFHNYTYRPV